MDRREFGQRGERTAERVLRRAGLTILARNWRAAGGELDLAALEGETLVFVEVKARESGLESSFLRQEALCPTPSSPTKNRK